MDPRIAPLRGILQVNTRMLERALDGLTEHAATERPNRRINSIAYLASHLVEGRHFLVRYLGGQARNPFGTLLEGSRGVDEPERLPTLESLRSEWQAVSAEAERRLAGQEPSALDAPSPQAFPIPVGTVAGGVAFLLQHESYHVGQLVLVRKYLGFGAVSFS